MQIVKMKTRLQNSSDDQYVETLLDVTFGSNRYDKAAYGLREGVDADPNLSFVVEDNEVIIATLRFWAIKIGSFDALLLGPIAVLPVLQGKGIGIQLMKYGLMEATKQGSTRVVLVGDEVYYQKVGFNRVLAENLTMPGQKDESRLLAQELVVGAFENVSGTITKT